LPELISGVEKRHRGRHPFFWSRTEGVLDVQVGQLVLARVEGDPSLDCNFAAWHEEFA